MYIELIIIPMLYFDSIKPQFHIVCEDESSTLDQKKLCLIKFAKQTILKHKQTSLPLLSWSNMADNGIQGAKKFETLPIFLVCVVEDSAEQ